MSQNDKLYQIFLSHPDVTSDTRALIPNGIFFALKGGNFDGNQFAAQALEGGCAYAVVDNPAVVHGDRYILVDDVLTAMQQLAARHRRELSLPILQVTGTNGKTTTKELLAAVLGRKFRLLYTQGNLNNHIGVPKTLLRLRPEHQLAIIETGANHPGEIADLCRIVQADCGVITNVGMAHLEGFGSFEGVVRTKSELYDDLRQRGGYIFLHGEDDILRRQAVGLPAVTYGLTGQQNAVEGEVVACDPCLRFRWRRAGGDWNCVPTQLIGAYNISNALCAISAGIHFGVPDADINAAISEYCPTNNRSELLRTAHNTLIVDAYNANLTSMTAALENFGVMEHTDKLAILGEMRELGDFSVQAHLEVLQRLLSTDCKEAWLVGQGYEPALAQLTPAQRSACRILPFPNVESVKAYLQDHPQHDRLILVKGSNGTRLFTLPEHL